MKTENLTEIINLHTDVSPKNNYSQVISPSFLYTTDTTGWWRGTVVERRYLAGELSLSCARPAADG